MSSGIFISSYLFPTVLMGSGSFIFVVHFYGWTLFYHWFGWILIYHLFSCFRSIICSIDMQYLHYIYMLIHASYKVQCKSRAEKVSPFSVFFSEVIDRVIMYQLQELDWPLTYFFRPFMEVFLAEYIYFFSVISIMIFPSYIFLYIMLHQLSYLI